MPTRLWITYAWDDKADGNFTYLVDRLSAVGVDAVYDEVALVPGQRLWEQIADHIISGEYDGWAYLLTPQSIASLRCKEELGYAMLRALDERGAQFPLIGLIHQTPIDQVPASLRIRLCVPLSVSDWPERVKAGVNRPGFDGDSDY